MSHRGRVLLKIPETGGHVAAQPESAGRTVDGKLFVWARRHDTGEITRAFGTGEMV